MNIEDIINQINSGGNPKRGLYFELFIQNLLKLHLEKQGKHFVAEYPIGKYRLDGYSKDGIGHYEGAVAFEVKYLRLPSPMIVKHVIEQMTHILDFKEIKYIILICPIASDWLKKFFKNENPRLILWGITEINELIDENREKAKYIANKQTDILKMKIKSK